MYTYSKSAELLERAKKSLAGGVASEFRKYNHPHAIFYDHAVGSRIYDVDGNEYLDFTLSQGPMILGHNHPHVVQRVAEYSKNGQLYAGQHILEIELAEKLQHIIPSAELMRFCLDGSEAIQTAFRVSRAKTSKQKFIRFEGHYHGWLDNVAWGLSTPSLQDLGSREKPNVFPWTAGLPAHVEDDFIILSWNDLSLLTKVIQERHHEIAAIITEPIMCNNSCIQPKEGYLQGMRDLCDAYHISLIFDEVITGFRMSLGGAQHYYSITPDLAIFAKAIASGYPISAIVGKKDWMNLIADSTVIHAGTMNSSNATVAAAMATLEVLESSNVYEKIYNLGLQLMDGLRAINKKYDSNLLVQGLGPMFHAGFTPLPAVYDYRDTLSYDKVKLNKFIAGMHDRGVRIIGRGLWYISAAHTQEDIETALDASMHVFKQI